MVGIGDRIDRLARSIILEINRHHTTGMPRSGPHRSLTSQYGSIDGDFNGQRGDELLSQAGFQFDVQAGDLYVTVTDTSSGSLARTRIAIDPAAMTLEDLAARIADIDHLSASVDPTGHLRVSSDSGYGFDFSPRLDPDPNSFGSFGGTQPTIGSANAGPFDLSAQTFPVSFSVTAGTANTPTVTNVTLDASDVANTAAVTVDELVAGINDDLGSIATAANVGGRLVIRSNSGGASSQLGLSNNGAATVLSDLGLSTTTVMGQDVGVAVAIEGNYSGTDNGQLVFVPESDGTIGVTPDLRVRVMDDQGNLVTTLNVGSGYEPGKTIGLGNGVEVSFGSGSIRGSSGEAFALDVLADSDSSDILVALGMNSFFHGSNAADIEVNNDLLNNVDGLAAGVGLASGDAGNLERLMALRDIETDSLDANTIEDFWADVGGDVGFETASARQALLAQDQLMRHLEAERESVSGVNLDEEMLDMVRYQQSFDAAARFLSTVQELTQSLINIGR